MPGGDGTGPSGMGPMTGRRAGYCAGYPTPGYANPIGSRGWGFGYGNGWGRGRGWGRGGGFGRRWAVSPYINSAPYYPNADSNYPYGPELSPKDESQMLKDQALAMQKEIEAINERIATLEKT